MFVRTRMVLILVLGIFVVFPQVSNAGKNNYKNDRI